MNLKSDKKEMLNAGEYIDISQEITPKTLDNKEQLTKSKNKYEINNDIKRQRINNTFCMASKLLKKEALTKFSKIDDYLASSKYSYIAGLLKDCSVAVVSKSDMILTTKYESIINDIYENYVDVLSFLKLIMNDDYRIVLLSDIEFTREVDDYKSHMKDANYYKYIEEKEPFIKFPEIIEKKADLGYTNLVDKAIDVFGTDIVEIE